MSGWHYETLRDKVEHAVGEVQCGLNENHGVQDITQIDTELNQALDKAIEDVTNLLWKQLNKELNPVSTHYCEKDDITFIMKSYYEAGILEGQECIGWYYGEPNPQKTIEYMYDLKADYTNGDHRGK